MTPKSKTYKTNTSLEREKRINRQSRTQSFKYERASWFSAILPFPTRNTRKDMASTNYFRGTQTLSSMFFKPMIRKSYHRKSTPDVLRNTAKPDGEEAKCEGHVGSASDGGSCWVPHEATGIYYPKGQEKVIKDITSAAAKDVGVNWLSYTDDI